MITIDRGRLDLVAKEYLSRLRDYGKDHKHSEVGKIVKDLSADELEDLILCPPEQLKKQKAPGIVSDRFLRAFYRYFAVKGNDGVNNAIWLLMKLNIKVCPYCNRTYTFTVKKKPKKAKRQVRPELDHFFPKSKYAHLTLSFYNLVPSCPQCNHLKGDNEFDYHPYYGDLNGKKIPRIEVENVKRDAKGFLVFPDAPKVKIREGNENTKVLGLQELYEQHEDYVKEILDKIQAYNKDYYDSLVNSFQGMGKKQEEIDRLVWGSYIEEAAQEKRPLSKMTRDLLKQFEVI